MALIFSSYFTLFFKKMSLIFRKINSYFINSYFLFFLYYFLFFFMTFICNILKVAMLISIFYCISIFLPLFILLDYTCSAKFVRTKNSSDIWLILLFFCLIYWLKILKIVNVLLFINIYNCILPLYIITKLIHSIY